MKEFFFFFWKHIQSNTRKPTYIECYENIIFIFFKYRIGFRVFFAPLLFVHFADFWMADQTNSMVPIFLDLQTFFCFYSKNSNLSYVDGKYIFWQILYLFFLCIIICSNICVFLYHYTEDNICLTQRSYIRPIFAMLPAWFRCAQCLRRFADTKLVFPHLVNAVKYTTGLLVVVFSVVCSVTTGEFFSFIFTTIFYSNSVITGNLKSSKFICLRQKK